MSNSWYCICSTSVCQFFAPLSRYSEFEDVEIAEIFKLPVLIEKERERALFLFEVRCGFSWVFVLFGV